MTLNEITGHRWAAGRRWAVVGVAAQCRSMLPPRTGRGGTGWDGDGTGWDGDGTGRGKKPKAGAGVGCKATPARSLLSPLHPRQHSSVSPPAFLPAPSTARHNTTHDSGTAVDSHTRTHSLTHARTRTRIHAVQGGAATSRARGRARAGFHGVSSLLSKTARLRAHTCQQTLDTSRESSAGSQHNASLHTHTAIRRGFSFCSFCYLRYPLPPATPPPFLLSFFFFFSFFFSREGV